MAWMTQIRPRDFEELKRDILIALKADQDNETTKNKVLEITKRYDIPDKDAGQLFDYSWKSHQYCKNTHLSDFGGWSGKMLLKYQ